MSGERNYLYVMPTQDYVKFGISIDPARRLARHMTDLNQDLKFSDIWHSEIDKYKNVEKIVKMILADYDQDTNERVYAERPIVVSAIERAAKTIDARLVRFDVLPFNEESTRFLPKRFLIKP